MSNAIWWLRRDLRLADNPALQAALDEGFAVLPVYVHAPGEEAPWAPGAASRAWLHRSLAALSGELEARGSRLLLRSGDSTNALLDLQRATGAEAVFCNNLHEPATIARDERVFAALEGAGAAVHAFDGNLLLPPQVPRTAAGSMYRVFGAWWRAASALLGEPRVARAPADLPGVPGYIESEALESLGLLPAPR